MRQWNWIAGLSCLILLSSCGQTLQVHKPQPDSEPEKSPFSNNLTGNVTVLPLQTLPRRNQRRYINHNGGEAIVYNVGGQARILTRASERFGDFQLVPYNSTEDPVVLPLPTGQVFVASKDKLLVRGVCPDVICSFSEYLTAPTRDKPLAFDQDSLDGGDNASLLFMVNGTKWVYSYDLLQRKWNQAFALPSDHEAIAIKRIGTKTIVLDRTGDTLWIHVDGSNSWKQISLLAASDGPFTQIANVKDQLVLASKKAILVAPLDSVLANPQGSSPQGATRHPAWNKVAPPGGEQILQISADSAFLYCTTGSGNTSRMEASELNISTLPQIDQYQQILQSRAALGLVLAEVVHEGRRFLNPVASSAKAILDGKEWLLENSKRGEVYRRQFPENAQAVHDGVRDLGKLFKKLDPISGRKRGRPGKISVCQVIQRALDLFQDAVSSGEIMVDFDCDGTLLGYGYEEDIQAALMNIIDNGLFWLATGDQPRKMNIDVTSNAKSIRISIKNNGPLIAGSYFERLFEAGFTLKSSGTGLGLAISREAMRRSKGDVSFDQDSPETKFEITIPRFEN